MDEYQAANRALWDEWADINARSEFYGVEAFKAGRSKLRPFELEEIGDVRGKDLLHLQCHFGLDTLSWAREGARVTGVDFSPRAIELARELAGDLGIEARFIEAGLDELPQVLREDFDVVYTSRGVLGWLPDVPSWARIVARYVRPGGFFYIHEMHPFLYVFDDTKGVTEPRVRFPYFPRKEPLRFPVEGSYAEPTAEVKQPFSYDWPHSMGEIITSVAEAGLTIDFLHEWPFLDWEVPFLERRGDSWWLPEDQPGELPLSFSLKASRPR